MADVRAAAPAAPRWPGETQAAGAFTFDMDAETLWMARDIHEPVALLRESVFTAHASALH